MEMIDTTELITNSRLEIEYAGEQLGPEGPGVALLRNFIKPDLVHALYVELVTNRLWSRPDEYFANRPNVVQDYEKIALILSHGDQSVVDAEMPSIRPLIRTVGKFALGLEPTLPALSDWFPNDIDCHRYPGNGMGLGKHKDYPRNPKLIAIANVAGSGVFGFDDERLEVTPGDMLLMRAPNLFEADADMRPVHWFMPSEEERICVVLRQDNHPHATKPYDGSYDNWPYQFSG